MSTLWLVVSRVRLKLCALCRRFAVGRVVLEGGGATRIGHLCVDLPMAIFWGQSTRSFPLPVRELRPCVLLFSCWPHQPLQPVPSFSAGSSSPRIQCLGLTITVRQELIRVYLLETILTPTPSEWRGCFPPPKHPCTGSWLQLYFLAE